MSRAVASSLVALALGTLGAPLQCGSGHEPALHEDSAGDALYKLAQDFRAKGNEGAARDALRYLVEHYPSNRHVPAARAELEAAGKSAPSPDK